MFHQRSSACSSETPQDDVSETDRSLEQLCMFAISRKFHFSVVSEMNRNLQKIYLYVGT